MCRSSNKAPHTWFSTEFKGGTGAIKARMHNLLAPARTHKGVVALILVLLAVALAGGLVAFRFFTRSGAYIDMDIQYYNTFGAYLEIPILRGDDNEAVRAINADLAALKSRYIRYMDDPYGAGDPSSLFAYPSTTEDYLNVIVIAQPPGYGSDGDVRAWVYDRRARAPVTTEQALAMANTTEADLLDGLAARNRDDAENPREVLEAGIDAFRIRPDGQPEFFLFARVSDTPQLDGWRRLYLWSQGTYTRLSHYFFTPQGDPFEGVIPLSDVDETASPLWCRWGPGGVEPEGGFFHPVPSAEDPEFDNVLMNTILPALYDISDQPDWYYSVSTHTVEKVGNLDYAARPVFLMDKNDSGSIVSYLGVFFRDPFSGAYYLAPGGDSVLQQIVIDGTSVTLMAPPDLPGSFYRDGPLYDDALRHLKSTLADSDAGEYPWTDVGPITLAQQFGTDMWSLGLGVGVYHCPATPRAGSDWSDPKPYLVFGRDYTGYYYIGALSEEELWRQENVWALVEPWAEAFAADRGFPLVTGADRLEVLPDRSALYTNAAYGFTLTVPAQWERQVLFRPRADGLDVYYSVPYGYWAAQQGRSEDNPPDSAEAGLVYRILVGEDKGVFRRGFPGGTRWPDGLCTDLGWTDPEAGLPAPDGRYYCITGEPGGLPTHAFRGGYLDLVRSNTEASLSFPA